LEQAIEKYKANFLKANQPTDFEAIKALFQNQNQTKEYKKRFSIKIGEHIKIINTSDIECIFSQDKGTFIHTFENRDYLTDFTMDQMADYLNPEEFFKT
jgi:DNA-binding LytR/AlgR family response regulator